MDYYSSVFQDILTDPFFRTSPAASHNLRRMAQLMDAVALQSSTGSFSYPSRVSADLVQRNMPQRPAYILRQADSAADLLKNTVRHTEDEEWRNSLRRSSINNALSYRLPAINAPRAGSLSTATATKRRQTGTNNSHSLEQQRQHHSKRFPKNHDKDLKNPSRDRHSPKESKSGSSSDESKDQSEDLVSDIAATLGCESHLVEMIERDVLQRKPSVPWSTIAGLEEAKTLLQEAVVLPQIVPDFFKGLRRPWKGVILIGPPGTGKTMLAKAVATECKSTFFNVTSSTLTSKYRGESEKLVRILFHMARKLAPSIIFFDEVDAMISKSGSTSDHEALRRFQAELLIQMDGLQDESSSEPTVLVLAATNHPWNIDDAFRRRFEKRIYIPIPNQEARESMLKFYLADLNCDPSVNVQKIAKRLDGYSGADILSVCRDAAMMSLRKKISGKSNEEIRRLSKNDLEEPITAQDFQEAIKRCKTSVNPADMARYEAWMKTYGSF